MGIVDAFDCILDSRVLRLRTEGTEPTVVKVFAMRVIANDELLIGHASNSRHFLHPNHSVCVFLQDAKFVS